MSTKTTHIGPSDGGWTVRREGARLNFGKKNRPASVGRNPAAGDFAVNKGGSERSSGVYPTQKEAIDAARAMVQQS